MKELYSYCELHGGASGLLKIDANGLIRIGIISGLMYIWNKFCQWLNK